MCRYVMRAGVFAKPALRSEGLRLHKVVWMACCRTHENGDASPLRDKQVPDYCLYFGLEDHHNWRYWADAHRFVSNRSGPNELVGRLNVGRVIRSSEKL